MVTLLPLQGLRIQPRTAGDSEFGWKCDPFLPCQHSPFLKVENSCKPKNKTFTLTAFSWKHTSGTETRLTRNGGGQVWSRSRKSNEIAATVFKETMSQAKFGGGGGTDDVRDR